MDDMLFISAERHPADGKIAAPTGRRTPARLLVSRVLPAFSDNIAVVDRAAARYRRLDRRLFTPEAAMLVGRSSVGWQAVTWSVSVSVVRRCAVGYWEGKTHSSLQ